MEAKKPRRKLSLIPEEKGRNLDLVIPNIEKCLDIKMIA